MADRYRYLDVAIEGSIIGQRGTCSAFLGRMGIIKTESTGLVPDGAPDKRGPGNQDNQGSTGGKNKKPDNGGDMHTDLARGTDTSKVSTPGAPNKLSQPKGPEDRARARGEKSPDDIFATAQKRREALTSLAGNHAPGSAGHDEATAKMRALDQAQNKHANNPSQETYEELEKQLA